MMHLPRLEQLENILFQDGEYIPGIDFRTLIYNSRECCRFYKVCMGCHKDVDGDDVQYRMIGYQGLEFLSMMKRIYH